jgi:hypothetical protein
MQINYNVKNDNSTFNDAKFKYNTQPKKICIIAAKKMFI